MSVCITTETWSLVIVALEREKEREREREREMGQRDHLRLYLLKERERFLSNKYTCKYLH